MQQAPAQRGKHLAGLVAIVVDRRLAHDHEARLFLGDHAFEDLGDREWLDDPVGLDQNAAVVASACAASRSLAPARSTRLRLPSPCLPAKRFLDGDLVEWIHRHLDVSELHARTVRLDADLDVVIHHARCRRSLQASPAT